MKQIPTRSWISSALAVLAISGFPLLFLAEGYTQTKGGRRRAPSSSKAVTSKSTVEAPPLLRQGEKLEYTASLSKLSNVATIGLAVMEKCDFYGRSAWHLQAVAHTINPMRIVYELDDQFDSYSDASNLEGLQYEMRLSERGAKQNAILRLTSRNTPAPSNATATYVPPGTRDPLGLVAYLRTVDWQKQKDVSSPVYDGHNLYDVKARLISASSTVTVPAGSYTISRIELRVYQGNAELKDTHFWLSVGHDQAHTPVLLEAETVLGVARLELRHP